MAGCTNVPFSTWKRPSFSTKSSNEAALELLDRCSHVYSDHPCYCIISASNNRALTNSLHRNVQQLLPPLNFDWEFGEQPSLGYPNDTQNLFPLLVGLGVSDRFHSGTKFGWLTSAAQACQLSAVLLITKFLASTVCFLAPVTPPHFW
jgi:hypothetical protein